MKCYFYSESSLYSRHMVVKAAIVCVESGRRKKKQGKKLADALPFSIPAIFKMASPALALPMSHWHKQPCSVLQACV